MSTIVPNRPSAQSSAQPPAPVAPPPENSDHLRLRDVRAVFRLVNDVRELGADPQRWRPHMVRRLSRLLRAGIIVSSEIHFRKNPRTGTMRVIDIGWVNAGDGNVSQIHTERDDESPEAFWLVAGAEGGPRPADHAAGVPPVDPAQVQAGPPAPASPDSSDLVPVKPARKIYGGTTFILSQVSLPHAGAVDQLGLHREWGDEPFTRAEHRLVRLFHVELARLWKRDVLRRAEEPTSDLPPASHRRWTSCWSAAARSRSR